MKFSPLIVTFTSLILSSDAQLMYNGSLLCKILPQFCPEQEFTPITTPAPSPSSPSTSPPTSPPTTSPISAPTTSPISAPTTSPSTSPTTSPSISPTDIQSSSPSVSASPTEAPSKTPTSPPSSQPTEEPSESPTKSPTNVPTPSPTMSAQPNLIMILTDEHSMRSLGCYRDFMKSENQADQAYIWGDGVEVETPNIDRLANEGTLFSNFYTVAPLCTPSRASFMSGLYPQKTGESDDNHGRMDDDITTFAKILKSERDYLTAYLGKWHLNGDQKPGWGNSKRKFGFGDTTYQFNRGHWKFLDVVDGARKAYEFKNQKRFQDKEDKHFTTDFLFDRGIEFMESARLSGQPFASVLSIPDPHGPMEVRDPYQNMYKHFNFNLPSTAITALKRFPASPLWNYLPDHANVTLKDVDEHLENYEGFFQGYLQQYFGMVKCIDDNVGKLLDYLQRTGIDNDTIIVFTSDHGDMLGEHGKMNKGRPYKTAAGIPFLVRQPGTVPQGKVIKTAHSSIDFFPSMLSLTNTKYDASRIDGTDFKSELLNERNVTNGDNIVFTYDTGKSPTWLAAIQRQYKVVISATDVPWLFDMEEDPDEIYNFFDDPKYATQRDVLLDSLYEVMEKHDMPLKDKVAQIFWSTPLCQDSRDRIWLKKGVATTCESLDFLPNKAELCKSDRFKKHCPVSCGDCCTDTVDKYIWSRGKLKTCEMLTEKECSSFKGKEFCPITCNYMNCESKREDESEGKKKIKNDE